MSRPLHPRTADAIQCIDAAVFNGDSFHDEANRDEMLQWIERWHKRLIEDALPEKEGDQ